GAEGSNQVSEARGVLGWREEPHRPPAPTARGRRPRAARRGKHRISTPDDCKAGSRRPRREGNEDVSEAAGGKASQTHCRPGSIVPRIAAGTLFLLAIWGPLTHAPQ